MATPIVTPNSAAMSILSFFAPTGSGKRSASSDIRRPMVKRGRRGGGVLTTLDGVDWSATLTYSRSTESHVGTQIHGTMASTGYTMDDLKTSMAWASQHGIEFELVRLHTRTGIDREAHVLVLRDVLSALDGGGAIVPEFETKVWPKLDRKMVNWFGDGPGRVCNKWARGNAEIGPHAVPSTLAPLTLGTELGRGTSVSGVVLPYSDLPAIESVAKGLPLVLGGKANDLRAEVNFYGPEHGADASRTTRQAFKKCGISWHGDSERPDVVGLVVGSVPKELRFQAFRGVSGKTRVGHQVVLKLESGDMYIMDEVACGHRWKHDRNHGKVHYQHSAGSVGGNKHTGL